MAAYLTGDQQSTSMPYGAGWQAGLGRKTGEDLSAYYDRISSEIEPTEENINDFLLGYKLGGSIIIAEMAEILTSAGAATAGMISPSPGAAAVVEVIGTDGRIYQQEVAGSITIIDEGLLPVPGVRVEWSEGDSDSKIPQKAKDALDKIEVQKEL